MAVSPHASPSLSPSKTSTPAPVVPWPSADTHLKSSKPSPQTGTFTKAAVTSGIGGGGVVASGFGSARGGASTSTSAGAVAGAGSPASTRDRNPLSRPQSSFPDTIPPATSERVTRSSARLAADAGAADPSQEPDSTSTARGPAHSAAADLETKTPTRPKKRKASARLSDQSLSDRSPKGQADPQSPTSSVRRSKRRRTSTTLNTPLPSTAAPTRSTRRGGTQKPAMSEDDSNEVQDNNINTLQETTVGSASKYSGNDGESSLRQTRPKSSSRSASHKASKKPTNSSSGNPFMARRHSKHTDSEEDGSPPSKTATSRKSKTKKSSRKDSDVEMKDAELPSQSSASKHDKSAVPSRGSGLPDSNSDMSPDGPARGDRDPFASAMFGAGGGPSSLSSTLRALSGMMTGMTARFRDILENLRRIDEPTMQMIALEELSNLLLVSNEDNLAGQFSPDPYVKELVALMQPNPITMEENPEIMLLACRCLANLIEAMRGSVANVVYGGAVPVLCQKLLDIQFIDVAEQALSTLSKISLDFPTAIVREGGLTACLQFLDFFATGTQRTAVTTAANCCRNIPHDSFAVVRDVMPNLRNVLVSHDQKVVEQGSLCVTRIIDSFKHNPDKLEQLVDTELLRAVLALLLPGTTNLIGAHIHTEFLRVLAIIARNSPRLATELLKLNVVDTLYQILTGVSPPSNTTNAATSIDSVVIMQALIHRPKEQIYEALNIMCELLPAITPTSGSQLLVTDAHHTTDLSKQALRRELLQDCKSETRRFAMVLLPTLTDAYSSTVNLSVRQKVLTAQLKMLSNLEVDVILEALKPVPYASFLASILSQEDHPSLVMFALQASELLFERLEDIYRYQFYREGVILEIQKLASRTTSVDPSLLSPRKSDASAANVGIVSPGQHDEGAMDDTRPPRPRSSSLGSDEQDNASEDDEENDENDEQEENDNDHEDEDEDEDIDDEDPDELIVNEDIDIDDEQQDSDSDQDEIPAPLAIPGVKDLVILRAKAFLQRYDTGDAEDIRSKAQSIRTDLRQLAETIRDNYKHQDSSLSHDGNHLFEKLADYFCGDALDSITSSELLDSGIITLLVDILSPKTDISDNVRGDFVAAFMGKANTAKVKTAVAAATTTPFTALILKLQDLLSRAEHFEVLTVNNSPSESTRTSSTSMLSRQIKLHLKADDDSGIPQSFRDMIVSIHAIATFKALDDYLKPRIMLSERASTDRSRNRRDMLQQLASARMAQLSGAAESGLFSPFGTELGSLPPSHSPSPSSRHSSRAKKTEATETRDEDAKAEPSSRRRSSRRQETSSLAETPASRPPEPSTEVASSQLAVADEKDVDDGPADQQFGNSTGLDSVLGEVEERTSDDDQDPDAVNMEVGSGGKVTARKEDGSRVYTPRQPGTPLAPSRTASTDHSPSALRSASSSRRHGAQVAPSTAQQDWHIEFSIEGKPLPDNITIYRAVHHHHRAGGDTGDHRMVWAGIHEVKLRRASGPAPASKLSTSEEDATSQKIDGLPSSLANHPITSSILSLLGLLHEINASLDDVREALERNGLKLNPEPLASYINTKLTAKMNRQLEEPLIVASNCLPEWSEDLARSFPFLFPFETRHLFLQSTSFGYARSITRWQNSQENDDRRDRRRDDRPMMGRPQRQKVRISRTKMLESAMKVMDHFGPSPSILEVEYFDEVGTGLGPTLEFYSTVSKEFAKKSLNLWRENDTDSKDQYAFGKNGLFPAPMSQADKDSDKGKRLLDCFKVLGKFVARSMLDSRIIDINFNPNFFRIGEETEPSIALLRSIDQDLANSLAQLQAYANKRKNILTDQSLSSARRSTALVNLTIKGASIEDLSLDFTLPGYPHVELVQNGASMEVTAENVELYIQKVLNMSLGVGILSQLQAFRSGFSQVFPYNSLKAFTPNELVMLFGRVEEDWSVETLTDSIKADHGFNMDSKSVRNLLQVMSELTASQRRDFLQFVTGSPRLPIGGFKSLTPMFTVVCKPSEAPYTSDDYLPSVMTCANYLKLPDYSDVGVLKQKLRLAIKEGQGAFHLS